MAAPRVAARPAATTLILRDGAAGLEVLMVRRSLQASFMPGAYVFPGGAVDAADGLTEVAAVTDESPEQLAQRLGTVAQLGDQALAFAVGALRECFEECGLWLGLGADEPVRNQLAALRARLHAGAPLHALARDARLPLATRLLQPWSRWVTPVGVPKRFDTLFVLCPAPAGQVPEVDAGETTTLAWVHPRQALDAFARAEFPMEFATVRTVQSLEPFARQPVSALLAHAAALPRIDVIHPRLKLDEQGQVCGVLMPGQPGYELALGDG